MLGSKQPEKAPAKKISGAEYPLSKIFSSEFEFIIPSYQRPYAWEVDQASELLDDLCDFCENSNDDGYFLGSIVLIKSEGIPCSEVIDGQQRLTTLTILLAALACAHSSEYLEEIKPYILEAGKKMEGIQPKVRLSLRERDQPFFEKYIQNFALSSLADRDPASLDNESQRNIRANSIHLLQEISKRFETLAQLQDFVTFLLTRCFLVTVSTPTQESAFRVFSVMNSRGLDLQPTDIIKADIVGKIRNEDIRNTYNVKWESMEVELTRSGFNDLFSYIRMIYAKEKAKRTLLEEFKSSVVPKNPDPCKFIDEVLEPFADALIEIRSLSFASTNHAEVINGYLKWLHRIDNSDWVPPAMLYLKIYRNKPAEVALFFKLLERVAAYMHISRWNVNKRIEVYGELIVEIEKGLDPNDMDQLKFDKSYTKEFRETLNGEIYNLSSRKRNYLMLRLDSFVADGAATYDPKILTIEHVLPQTVKPDGEWAELWPDEDVRGQWVHRLANLVPLNKKKNSEAQNFDFKKKCEVYFSGTKNISSYALTSQVLAKSEWTISIVKQRQKLLLDTLMQGWELNDPK
ncbi:DUF262 domain-containing HNH endonuclease family protein [Methylobacterium sp. WCS2018Hpa-22]|uniref:DUF262 domain-containing protein n=1 Tax=Methylobacterium sp. WCS2018Hpa-22 TaxID=3073633 RepID=UPI002889FC3B|nr:DUF262 domain-containing HNH endonuclease family protein [Methylobacterium sp. WCS2018Hpa-22]